jgi:hypothetical protein
VLREIQPTLAPGDQGPEVANLKAALLFLLAQGYFLSSDPPEPYTPPPAQGPDLQPTPAKLQQLADTLRRSVQWDPTLPPVALPRQAYDDATQALVAFFQAQENLSDPVGFVADATAKRLNAWLRQRGAFEEAKRRLQGLVRQRGSGTPLAGVLVRALLSIGNDSHLLGESRSSADGIYAIDLDAATLSAKVPPGEPIPLLVQALDTAGMVVAEARVELPADQEILQLDLLVETGESEPWLVRGRVSDQHDLGVPALKVIAFDRDLRSETALGEPVLTNAEGMYAIRYNPASTLAGEANPSAPDLVVRVYQADDNQDAQPLAQSGILFNAGPIADIHLTVERPEPIEFEQVSQAITPLLVGSKLRPEDLDEADLAFITGDTGLEPLLASAWMAGARIRSEALALLGDASDGHHAVLMEQGWPFGYAWMRQGWADSLGGLLASDPALWANALDSGAARRWIAAPTAQQREQLLAALAGLKELALVDPIHSPDPIAPLMAPYTGAMPRETAAEALNLYREKGEAALADLPALARGNPDLEKPLATLARGIRVHGLVEGREPLIAPLMQRLDGPGTGLEGLLALSSREWQGLVAEHLGDDPASMEVAYGLQVSTERSAPEQAVITRLEQGELAFPGQDAINLQQEFSAAPGSVNELLTTGSMNKANTFFAKNPELVNNLVQVGQWMKGGLSAADAGLMVQKGLNLPNLITNGRTVYPIPPGGPQDPMDIVSVPRFVGIINNLGRYFGRGLHRIVTEAGGGLGYNWFERNPGKIDTTKPVIPLLPPRVEGITSPTVRGMFGDLDDCLCRPCESVTGPAAYLVDLLRALQKEVSFQGDQGLALVQQRRPDILDLELTCDNAEVLLPHIDLAVEQLEWQVAALPPAAAQPGLTTQPTVAGRAVDGSAQSWLNTQAPATASDPWRPAQVDAAIRSLLAQTTAQPVAAALKARRLSPTEPLWILREGSGERSWLLKPLGFAGADATATATGWRLVGMSNRRTPKKPDPRLEPATQVPLAYEHLKDADVVYPWLLPFASEHLDLAALLAALGLDPVVFGPLLPAAYTANQRLHLDTLGMSEAQATVITTPRSGDALWNAWGFASSAALPSIEDPASGEMLTSTQPLIPGELLKRASFLIARSGLALEALEAALGTAFVGGYRLSGRDQCKTSAMRAERPATGAAASVPIDAPALDRLHRLGRLWRHLPHWPLPVLDGALMLMQAANTTPQLGSDQLKLLAGLERARRQLELLPELLLSLRWPLGTPSQGLPLAGAAAALGLGIDEAAIALRIGQPGTDLAAPLPVAALTWLHRHGLLSAALGRPIPELLQLLQWCGWGPTGLDSPGDPLRAVLEAAQPPSLADQLQARLRDADRLASLRGWSEVFAGCDLPLPVLTGAVIPNLRNVTERNRVLIDLRQSLKAIPEPPTPPSDKQLWDELWKDLKTIKNVEGDLIWEDNLLNELKQTFSSSISPQLSQELVDALSETKVSLAENSPLLSAEELERLQTRRLTAVQRYRFLFDRLIEKRGDREEEVATRLAEVVGAAEANQLLLHLRSTEPQIRETAVAVLSAEKAPRRPMDQVLPLFTKREAQLLLAPKPFTSWRARLDLIDGQLARREREGVLFRTMQTWVSEAGAAWPGDVVEAFLAEQLTVEPASSSSTAPRLAGELLLSSGFFSSTSATAPAELLGWLERIDRVFALQSLSPTVAALSLQPGLDWRLLVNPANTNDRERLVELVWLAQPKKLGLGTLALVMDPAADLARCRQALAERLRVAPETVTELVQGITTTPQPSGVTLAMLRQPATLRRLVLLAEQARRLKATGEVLATLLRPSASVAITAARSLLAQLSGPREWPKQQRRLADESRRRRRDALVYYLIHRLPGVKDPDALFERLLIDPQMQPCLETTRLKQATASMQLLIQRILEGLEPGAQASDRLRAWWGWMRSYRLWEANRKVFLYPENWLLPELRDDKSPEFRALESQLAEDELTANKANVVFGRFLSAVNSAAQTRVVSMFEHTDILPNANGDRPTFRHLYVVGRSPNPPHKYFWRRCRDFGLRWMEWSCWEPIELDINSDHVVPLIASGEIHLAWPQVKDDPESGNTNVKRWKIEVYWARFDGERWSRLDIANPVARSINAVPLEEASSALAIRSDVPIFDSPPALNVYLKGGIQGLFDERPSKRESPAALIISPQSENEQIKSLFQRTEPQWIAKLIKEVTPAKLNVYSRDVLRLFLHWNYTTDDNDPDAARSPTVLYGLISINELFTQPRHLRWHRENVSAEPVEMRDAVSRRQDLLIWLTKFAGLYTQHAGSEKIAYLLLDLYEKCAKLSLVCEVWVRFKSAAPHTKYAYKKLGTSDGDFKLSHPAYAGTKSLRPGEQINMELKVGEIQAAQAEITFSKLDNSRNMITLTAKADVAAVGLGHYSTQNLLFILDDAGALQSAVQPSEFNQELQYTLTNSGTLKTQSGDKSPLPVLPNSKAWGNGYQEATPSAATGSIVNLPSKLQSGPSSTGTTVFLSSLSGQPYELIPAGISGGKTLSDNGIWHYKEGDTDCFLDTNPDRIEDIGQLNANPMASRLSIYPHAWLRGGSFLQQWHAHAKLPSARNQSDDFGAALLPSSPSSLKPGLPVDVINGRWTFDQRLPNSNYWWEICLHAPLLIADQFSRQQRFEEADRWLRMVFDPLTSTTADPQAFLRFRRFRDLPRALSVAGDLKALAKDAATNSNSPPPSVTRVEAAIERWRHQPFRPFVIARQRHVAFLWRTLFAYLDNLLAWADSLYRRDTRESIQEALQLYIQVARLLGTRPRSTKKASATTPASFLDYQDQWDAFANAWLNALPLQTTHTPSITVEALDDEPPVEGLLYFCIPPNTRLFTYWDLIEDRLSNIRNCRTIDGVERALPLEAPEINIDELVRSVAAGGTPAAFLAESFEAPWPYRYATLLAQVKELIAEVKSLGAQLLGAFEKRDAEKLAQLRSTHELAMLDRMTSLRNLQIEEAERQLEALHISRDAIEARYNYLQRQLGQEGKRAPEPDSTAGDESFLGRLSTGNAHADSNLGLIQEEALQLEQLHYANWWTDADSVARFVAWGFNIGASVANIVALTEPALVPPGGSTQSEKVAKALGALASAASSTADGFKAISQIHHTQASRLAQKASNIRRRDEWAHQCNQALRELATLDKQTKASEARREIARKELSNHEQQREEAAITDAYLREKFTNHSLYQWHSSQLLGLYRATYGTALAMARRTRRAAERELGQTRQPLPRISDHWVESKSGLMAGERLQRDLKTLELAVLENHSRELELSRSISLRRLNPEALVDLITTGSCEFQLPEWLFDLDAPGHYLRRLKTIAVSIPCVSGPYEGVNLTLSLLKSDLRVSSLSSNYPQNLDGDTRFETRFHTESVFISSGRDDAGLFEANLRDERYLPFEGAGVISSWRLNFAGKIHQFDRTTITDAVLHLRYTARHGGADLADAAHTALTNGTLKKDGQNWLLLSLQSDFSPEWTRAMAEKPATLSLPWDPSALLPYWMLKEKLKLNGNNVLLQEWRQTKDSIGTQPTGWNEGRCTVEGAASGQQRLKITTLDWANSDEKPEDILLLVPLIKAG